MISFLNNVFLFWISTNEIGTQHIDSIEAIEFKQLLQPNFPFGDIFLFF